MAKRGKRSRRLLLGTLIAFVLVLGGGFLTLRMVLTPERLRTETVRITREATGLDVQLAAAELSMSPFGVRISELRIAGDQPEDEPLLTLQAALVRLNLAPLLARNVVIEQVSLEKPVLTLVKEGTVILLPGKLGEATTAGAANPTDKPAGAPGVAQAAQRFRGEIELLEVQDGVIRLRTPGGTEDVELSGINLNANLEATEGADRILSRGELHLAGLSLAALEMYRDTLDTLSPVIGFDLDFRPAEGTLTIAELRLSADPLDLRWSGEIVGIPAAPTIELKLEPQTLSMEELLPLVPPAAFPEGRVPTARGPVTVSAHVQGKLGDPASPPEVRTQIRFDNAEFGMEGFDVSVSQVTGTVTTTASTIEIDGLSASLGTGTLVLSGRVDGTDVPETAQFDLNVNANLDLGIVESAGLAPEGTQLAGKINAETRLQGAADHPESAQLSGAVALSEGRFQTAEMPVPLSGLSGHAELNGSDILIQDVVASLGRSAFSGAGSVTNAMGDPFVSFEGHSKRLDLTEFLPDPAATGAGTGSAAGNGPAPDAPLIPLIPLIPPIRAELKLAVDSLITLDAAMSQVELVARLADSKARVDASIAGGAFGKGIVMNSLEVGMDVEGQTMRGNFHSVEVNAHRVPLTNVTGNLALSDARQLSFSDVTASVWTGLVEGSADIDLTVPGDPAFEIVTRAKGLQANDFVSGLTPARDFLFGTLDIESSFSGRGATPEAITQSLLGNGTVDAREGRVNRGPQTQAIWNALNLTETESIPFEDLATAFAIRDGQLVTDELTLVGGYATWNASGFVGFDGVLDYQLEVELGDRLSGQFRQNVGRDLAALLQGTEGKIVLDLAIDGDVTKPRVSLDRSRLAARAKENAANALQKELERGTDKIGDALKGLFKGR